jgi:hypothetical protein
MSADRNDPIDRAIDEALASMVSGEPRRVSGVSVRQAAGESRRSSIPMWLAAAAVLIVALTVALEGRAPVAVTPAGVAQVVPSPAPVEVRSMPSTEPTEVRRPTPSPAAASRGAIVATTTEPVYEGLPRLTIASIDPPEPLRPERIAAEPLQVPQIEIAPLAVSSLYNEQEHK